MDLAARFVILFYKKQKNWLDKGHPVYYNKWCIDKYTKIAVIKTEIMTRFTESRDGENRQTKLILLTFEHSGEILKK